jgi:PadR family transcriptional regulator PadR
MATTPSGGQMDVLLLAVLSSGPAHGYAIIEDLRRRSDGRLEIPEGTVYPALHRLKAEGFLQSGWSTEAPRWRRTYELTRRSRALFRHRRDGWREFVVAVEAVLAEAGWPRPA